MINDIAAIQYLYGANTNIHTENTVYQWSPHSKVFETIYDAGGIDTIDASNQLEAVRINLNPGTFSSIGVSFNDGRDDVRDCLAMSYAVSVGGNVINLIENALGSIYDDTLIGNDANNLLVGNEGNDVLNGGLGNDTLQGGLGFDLLSGGAGEDIFVFDSVLSELNTDHIKDFSVTEADLVVLNHNIFSALTEIGQLLSTHFIAGAGLTSGQKADQLIVYNTTNGHLYYDPDGNGSHALICFAIIDNSVDLTANSFRVV
ncbi:MAG: M10 family metallopeptidase C-terminal domain-containing protein [Acinetobacter sp.]|nr:M10 family metallopeptidase C-terminal domain-containing protein [Acinetobacter sp.]